MHTRRIPPKIGSIPDERAVLLRGSGVVDSMFASETAPVAPVAGAVRALLLAFALTVEQIPSDRSNSGEATR